MKSKVEFVSHYNIKNYYSNSFNKLAQDIFDTDLTEWLKKSYSENTYIPFSYTYQNEIVANASAYLMHLSINNVHYKAIQIATVMTRQDFRNKGLSRDLIDRIIRFYEHDFDFFYLYANETVVEFYPKIGFTRQTELLFTMEAAHVGRNNYQKHYLQRLNMKNPTHYALVEELINRRDFSFYSMEIIHQNQLLLFQLLVELDDIIYYMKEEGIVVVFEVVDDSLHLYDIITNKPFNLQTILARIIPKPIKNIHFYFGVNDADLMILKKRVSTDEDVLFTKSALKEVPADLYFPLTSRA